MSKIKCSLNLREWIEVVLTNFSQVVLQENPLCGFIILIGLAIHSLEFAGFALLGSIVATIMAVTLNAPEPETKSGLYGFNAILSSIAVVFHYDVTLEASHPAMGWMVGYAIFTAMLATLLTWAFEEFSKKTKIPGLTAPFVISSWFFVAGTHFSPDISLGLNLPQQDADSIRESTAHFNYTLTTIVEGIGRGLSEIFLEDNLYAGYAILLAIFIASPRAGCWSLVGALLSILLAELLHIQESEIQKGLFSYCAILTAIALGSELLPTNKLATFLSAFSIIVATWLYAALGALFQPLGIPVYTTPFLLATWFSLFAYRNLRHCSGSDTV